MNHNSINEQPSSVWLIKVSSIIFVFILLISGYYVCDDAVISFVVAENIFQGFGPVYNIDERVQIQTNPMWTFILSLLRGFTGEYHYTSMLLSMVSVAGILILSRKIYKNQLSIVLLALTFILSKAVFAFIGSGLEVPLSLLLIFISIALLFNSDNIFYITLVCSLAVVNRLDLALVTFPIALSALIFIDKVPLKKRVSQFFLGGTPILAWLLFATIYYGSPLPNTYFAKVGGLTFPLSEYLWSGFAYYKAAFQRDFFSLFIMTLSIFLLFNSKFKSWRYFTVFLGMTLYLLYIFKTGGDQMFPRLLAVPTFLGSILAIKLLDDEYINDLLLSRFFTIVIIAITISVSSPYSPLRLFFLADQSNKYIGKTNKIFDDVFIHDFQLSWWHSRMFGHKGRWHPTPAKNTQRIFVAEGLAGYPPFEWGPGLINIDPLGLGDPLLARLPAKNKRFKPGHNPRKIPNGYLQSRLLNQNLIEDKSLHVYYDILRGIIQGPLFTPKRLRDIYVLNTGGYDYLIHEYMLSNYNRQDLKLKKPNISSGIKVETCGEWKGVLNRTFTKICATTIPTVDIK